jgi:DNA polymerase I
MASKKPVFYLIDGHAVAYRQYHGIPIDRFTTSSGEPTNATYGFTRILLDIIQKKKPDYLAVAFDAGLSGRDTVYAEYKGTREKMPEDLVPQITRIQEVVAAFNIPVLMVDGYEADDVIGTVTGQTTDVHFRIITGDRDLLQLLSDNVTVMLPARRGPDEAYDIPRFMEKYTIHPSQLVDQKALMGDTSDNIPGVAGIGEKTSAKLLGKYETLDGIYANIDAIKGANYKKLTEGRDLAYISQELAQIQRDVPIQLILANCQTHDFDQDQVITLFQELEFRRFINRLLNPPQDEEEQATTKQTVIDDGKPAQMSLFGDDQPAVKVVEHVVETIIVDDEAALLALVDTLNAADGIVWDVETTSIDQMQAELVGIALAVDEEKGYYVPVGHHEGQQLALDRVLDALRPALTNPDIPKYAHNAAYDLVVMSRYGVDVMPVAFDSMIAEWLLRPTSKFLGLKNFAIQYLGVNMTPISDLLGTGKKQKTMAQVAVEQAAPYAAADAAMTMQAVNMLRPQLHAENAVVLYETLELPLVPVIATMEQAGISLDTPYLKDMSQRLENQLYTLQERIYAVSGYGPFNINSPKQLNGVLFDTLGLPVEGLKKTTHGYSTNAATLDALIDEHEIIGLIVEYRELAKLKGTYVDALPELVNPETGRLHTSYNQTGTSTGRLSSNNPNLQNIPIRTEIGREVRRAFVAPPGRVLLAVDYSQIELRVLAHISKDQTLLDAFAQDQDIHQATAAAVYSIPLDEVTYEQRSFAKRVNFGLIYGMSAYRLARDSDLTQSEARAFVETYFSRLPKVQTYIQSTENKVFKQGYVETLLGRKRGFPGLIDKQERRNQGRIQAELRAAINMPIQGTAADIMKQAMIDVHAMLHSTQYDALMTLQVHDELVLEVVEDQLDAVKMDVVAVMENAYKMDVPLKANAQVGTNWRDMTNA